MMRTGALLFVLAFTTAVAAGAAPKPFHWGVNGHPHVQEGYRQVPISTQLDLVAKLGARWYRCDWSQGSLEKEPALYDNLVREAARRRLHILPVIFPSVSCRSEAEPAQIKAAAFEFARALVKRYGGKITHWELDNELDNFSMVRKGEKCRSGLAWEWGDPDGDKPDHYEEARYQKVRAELAGLYEGVKAADPDAMTIIDSAGWLHYGFFERLVREDKVSFDLLGWHWYSEMGDMTKVRGSFNVLEHLKGYGKPIWVTEVNRRGGSQGGQEHEQAASLEQIARQLRPYPGVEAFFAYELLDEPYFGADNPESYYGLVEIVRGPDGRWRVSREKEAFGALRALIRSLQR